VNFTTTINPPKLSGLIAYTEYTIRAERSRGNILFEATPYSAKNKRGLYAQKTYGIISSIDKCIELMNM
jgi:hypothetical protein